MNRVASVVVGLGLVLSVATEAQAQATATDDESAIEISAVPVHAVPAAVDPSERDVTIEITAAPPVASPVATTPVPDAPAPTLPTPPRAASDSPEAIEASWKKRWMGGVTVGVGSPLGLVGAWVGLNLSRHVDLTAGLGIGGSFGMAMALGVDWRPWIIGRWAVYGGAGLSMNFTPDEWRDHPALQAPERSGWLNLEVGAEYRAAGGAFFRAGIGHAVMLNTGEFTHQEFDGSYGPAFYTGTGNDPVGAADAHDEGRAFSTFFLHLDVGMMF
jgi:hypothetical protein